MIFPKFFSTFHPFFHLIQIWIDLEIWIFRSLENNWYLIGIFRKRAIESWDLWIGMDWFEWAFGKWVSKLNLIWTFENRSFDLWKIILWIFLIFGKSSNHLSNIWRRYNGSLNLYSFEKFGLWMFKKNFKCTSRLLMKNCRYIFRQWSKIRRSNFHNASHESW